MIKKIYKTVEVDIIYFNINDVVMASTDPIFADPYDDGGI